MNNIKTFFSAFYDLNKRDFWFLIVVTIAMGIVINLYPFHAFVKTGIIIVTAGYIFNFMRSASVLPSVSSDFDRYSWKYFQGLPLNKKELLIALALTDLLVMFPALVWLMAFFKQLSGIFTDSPAELSWAIKIFFFLIPVLLSISFSSIRNNITFPRKQYSKVDPRTAFFHFIKRMALWVTGAFYVGIIINYGSDYITWDPKPMLEWFSKNFPPFQAWYLIPVLGLLVVRQFFKTLKEWQDEKRSYIKIDWRPKRDFSIIGACLVLVWIPVKVGDFGTPDEFTQGKLVNATYKYDLKTINQLISAGEDVNKPNSFGFTPLLVAAYKGRYDLFTTLEHKGAKYDGAIKTNKFSITNGMNLFLAAVYGGDHRLVEHLIKKGFNPNDVNPLNKSSAIHYATNTCRPRLVSVLIDQKIKLNVQNKHGQTALHLAAKKSCFGAVALLLDAGIDPNIKDKDGKLASDYAKVNEKTYKGMDLAFYLEKKTRAPAGK